MAYGARAGPYLARQLGKHRATIRVALKRLQAKRQVATRMDRPARKGGGKGLFYITEETTETSESTHWHVAQKGKHIVQEETCYVLSLWLSSLVDNERMVRKR